MESMLEDRRLNELFQKVETIVVDAMRIIDELNKPLNDSGQSHEDYMTFRYTESDFSNFDWFRVSWWTPTRTQAWKRPTILDLMERTKRFEATNLRDKLFALLQLASNSADAFVHDQLIASNYTKSINTVISDFVRWQI